MELAACLSLTRFRRLKPFRHRGFQLPARFSLFNLVIKLDCGSAVLLLMSSSSQVPHRQLSLNIQGTKTDLVISSYEDHFLIIATQIGSMGTILHARKEQGLTTEPTFTVSTIFGKRDEPMLVACARKLIEHISSGSSKSLVLSLGLKDHSMEVMKAIVAAVIDNRLW